jgi:hypothetical protein
MLTAAWALPAQNGYGFVRLSRASPFAAALTLVPPTPVNGAAKRPPKTSRWLVHFSGVAL